MTHRWQTRAIVALWTAVFAVFGTVVAVAAGSNLKPDLNFNAAGHWLYNTGLGTLLHIDGGTKQVDAQSAKLPGGVVPATVAQGDGQIVTMTRDGVTFVFDKATMKWTVKSDMTVTHPEQPVSIEAPGGPYVVYRASGAIVRFDGQQPVQINAGGPITEPAVTPQGELWFERTSDTKICKLERGADRVQCLYDAPNKQVGAMVSDGSTMLFVDAEAGTATPVGDDGPGDARKLGIHVAGAKVATSTVGGRIAVIDPGAATLWLADADGHGHPVSTPLGAGKFQTPVVTGKAVVVVNTESRLVRTFSPDGREASPYKKLPGDGDVHVTRGEDGRVYVDNATGEHSIIADVDGSLSDVDTTKAADRGHGHTGTAAGKIAEVSAKPSHSGSSGHEPSNGGHHSSSSGSDDVTVASDDGDSGGSRDTTTEPPASSDHPTTTKAPPTKSSEPKSKPGAPTSVKGQPGNAQVQLTWSAAKSNGADIAGYTVTWHQAADPSSKGSKKVGTGTSATIDGLANGQAYVFTVTATNSEGTGPGADSAPVTPTAEVPDAPTGVQAKVPSADGTVSVSWTKSDGQGTTVAGYAVTANNGQQDVKTWDVPSGTSLKTPAGDLSTGTKYTFTVVAKSTENKVSKKSAASNSVAPWKPASAPQNLTANAGDRQVRLTWQAPADMGGGSLVRYEVNYNGSWHPAGTGTTYTATGLNNGTNYTFQVRAVTKDPNSASTSDGNPAQTQSKPGTKPSVSFANVSPNGKDVTVKLNVNPNGSGQVTCHVSIGRQSLDQACRDRWSHTFTMADYSHQYTVTASGSNDFGSSNPVKRNVTTGPPPKDVNASKGDSAAGDSDYARGCPNGGCRYINFVATGFKPNTTYGVECYAKPTNSYPSPFVVIDRRSDGSGRITSTNDGCFFGTSPGSAWVKIDGKESNHVAW